MQKISTCLWFDTQAEDAAKFYTSIFKNSKIGKTSYYPETGQETTGKQPGSVMTVEFSLEDRDFLALNGGPHFKFSPAISFVVDCKDQQEVDYYWEHLLKGGKESQCGWLTDTYGVSWQIVPTILGEMMSGSEKEKVERVMGAMMSMVKLDVEALKRAYDGV